MISDHISRDSPSKVAFLPPNGPSRTLREEPGPPQGTRMAPPRLVLSQSPGLSPTTPSRDRHASEPSNSEGIPSCLLAPPPLVLSPTQDATPAVDVPILLQPKLIMSPTQDPESSQTQAVESGPVGISE